MLIRNNVKIIASVLMTAVLTGAFLFGSQIGAMNVMAKTVTEIYKETPADADLEIRIGDKETIKVVFYTEGYASLAKKVTFTSSKKGIISVGKVTYKKMTYTDWYGKKYAAYRAVVKVSPEKAGTTTLTAKTQSGKKVQWKVTVKNAFTKQMAEGELGFIKWMLEKDGLTEDQKTDLNRAKRILELASQEKISDWLPNLKNSYGHKVEDGTTLDCSKKTDAAHISRLHANYEAYQELAAMQSKDAYRKIYLKDAYTNTASLPNEGEPYTNFTAVAGSMVDEDRFDVYGSHNPRWGEISADFKAGDDYDSVEYYDFACSEVWAGPSDAAHAVDLWFSERELVDDAVKDLGYQKSRMTAAQLDKALEQAGDNGVIGHYTFCLYADHNDIAGFASSSYGSIGHKMWRDEKMARYTFKEMDDYVTEYLNEIGY